MQSRCRGRVTRTVGVYLCAAALLAASMPQLASRLERVAILSSMRIRPYEQIAQAIEREVKGAETSTYYMDQDPEALSSISKMAPTSILTVGRQALKAAADIRGEAPLVFTMVLFPQEVLGRSEPGVSGIGMIPAPKNQLLILKNGFHFNNILVFYNPSVTGFLASYFRSATPPGMHLQLEAVSSDAELVRRLQSGLEDEDAVLLVPDPTVLTEQGLRSLITSCYASGVPLVGFSPMYLNLGAAVALSVTEEQTARMAVALAASSEVQGERLGEVYYPLRCKIQVSRKAASRLGLKVDEKAVLPYGDFKWGD